MSSSEQNIIQNGMDISDNKDIVEVIGEDKSRIDKTKLRAIIRAFLANIGIMVVKIICAVFTRSSAMLAEAIHSGVDSFNSICLLVGIKRGSKPADSEHPFGYGLEANIWAMFASILMLVGAAVAIKNGYEKFFHVGEMTQMLKNYNYVAIALIASMFFEAWAVSSAVNAVLDEAQIIEKNPIKKFLISLKQIRKIQSPTTKFVWYEDTAAFLGVFIAFIALTISKYVMPASLAHIPDAIASVIIGFILLYLAFYFLALVSTFF